MNRKLRLRALVVLCTLLGLSAMPARADDLAIVVAKSVALENVTTEELGKIFRGGETDGPNGVKLTVYNREKGSPERDIILKKVYHMNDSAYTRFFMQAVFTGAMSGPPRTVATAAAMKQAVAANAGAVSYLLASQVDDTVRIVKIDGVAPGDPKYALSAAP